MLAFAEIGAHAFILPRRIVGLRIDVAYPGRGIARVCSGPAVLNPLENVGGRAWRWTNVSLPMEWTGRAGRNNDRKAVLVGPGAGQIMIPRDEPVAVQQLQHDIVILEGSGVGVPEISPVEVLTDNPAGKGLAL